MTGLRRSAYSVLRASLVQYSLALLVVVALVVLNLAPDFVEERIAWFGLAWAALAVLVFYLEHRQLKRTTWDPTRQTIALALGLFVGFALLIRFIPYSQTELVIGYDYGFYKETMRVYEDASPAIPESSLPEWIQLQFEPGLLWLHQVLHNVAGLDASAHLHYVFPVLSGLLLVPVFVATRAFFGAAAGLGAAALYATSFTQYAVFQYLYEKNVLAMALLLLLFLALKRQSYWSGAILLGGIGVLHRPTFLLAAATLAIYAPFHAASQKAIRGWIIVALGSLPLWLPIWIIRWEHFFSFALLVIEGAAENVGHYYPEGGGTFLDFTEYQNAAVTYLPLAIAGGLVLMRRGRAPLPAIAFLLCLVNVTLHFVFYNRFIIMLDLVALLLVSAMLFDVLSAYKPRVKAAVVAAVVLLTVAPTWAEATKEPGPPYLWITDDQYTAIDWIRLQTPVNATILASNLHAPYVIADSDRRTFGPGLFDDPHVRAEWEAFFPTTNETQIKEFLHVYGTPLYILHVEGSQGSLGTSKFQPPLFQLEYDVAGAKVWRYEPGT